MKCKIIYYISLTHGYIGFSGDFIALDEPKTVDNKKGRLIRDDGDDDDISDDERVDMSNITGVKEREERREKFYSVQKDCMNFCFVYYFVFNALRKTITIGHPQ